MPSNTKGKIRVKKNPITKCLFPAAGYSTRFLPVTKAIPKEMLPVITKPLLQYGVEEAIEAGMDTMAIVTGRGKRAIEDHFDISYELEHQIRTHKNGLLNTYDRPSVESGKIILKDSLKKDKK